MNNVKNLINADLKRHAVIVTLPGKKEKQKLYLIEITAKTNLVEDLMQTYGKKATPTHAKIAKKIFGDKETDNIYGVLLDADMRTIFAFNRKFGDYDKKLEQIVYKDIDSLLTDLIPDKEQKPPKEQISRPNNDRPSGRMRYSLIEK